MRRWEFNLKGQPTAVGDVSFEEWLRLSLAERNALTSPRAFFNLLDEYQMYEILDRLVRSDETDWPATATTYQEWLSWLRASLPDYLQPKEPS